MNKDLASEIERRADNFTTCSKMLTAIGDETRQHSL